MPKEKCAPKIEALAEKFEAVKLMHGGWLATPPGSVPVYSCKACIRSQLLKLLSDSYN